jgi:UDP-hydrolysing UDP-N-acetyl-D-glucosamine 2-epimerase
VRTIGVVTVARSDYGIYQPILRGIQADPELRLHLMVSGMHLSPEFGLTVNMIERDGFEIGDRVEMLLSSDSPEGIAKSMGVGTMGFAQVYTRFRPDILLVLGDRFEMFAAALAALPFKIPVAHIHGGEVTQGAIDDALRHSLTKLSHLHFPATLDYAQRVQQLGEAPWRIAIAGAPALDHLRSLRWLDAGELQQRLGFALETPLLLVTFHPATLYYDQTELHGRELLAALETVESQIIFTLPNADTHGRVLIRLIEDFVRQHSRARIVENLGTEAYFSVMRLATAMVGNSSSGLIEAPSFELPVVNVGERQAGRVRAQNVIDVPAERIKIRAALEQAMSPEFRTSLRGMRNPYEVGRSSAAIIVDTLKSVRLDEQLLVKRFYDLNQAARST